MAKGLVNESSLNSIGSAINVLNGTEGTYMPSKMGEAIIDAIPTETASGNPIHITDAAAYPAESVITALEPVQDLHGYDKPWVGGTGKNLFDIDDLWNNGIMTNGVKSITLSSLPEGTYTISTDVIDNTDTSVASVFAMKNDSAPSSTRNGVFVGRSRSITLSSGDTLKIAIRVANVSSDAYWVWDKNTFAPYYIQLEFGSTATSYEPYSNICPITGHTEVELTRTGKNLLPPLPDYMYEVSGVTIKIQNSEVTLSGTATNTVLYDVRLSMPFVAEEGEYLHLCNSTTNDSVSFSFGGNNVNTFSKSTNTLEAISSVITENIGITCTYLRIYVANGANADITVKPMIVKSGTATAYEPYTSETHSITFPQAQSPVFGCEVDWVNGVLRVTEVSAIYDGSADESWSNRTAGSANLFEILIYDMNISQSQLQIGKCNLYPWLVSLTTDKTYRLMKFTLSVRYDGITLTEWKNMLSETSLQITYPLATPIEIPFTPEIITLLKGENNIWTDSGTSEIEYKVDLNSYIQKLIDEASAQASALSVSPLSLGKSATVSTDVADEPIEESEEAEKLPVDEVESVDEADEVEEEPAELPVEEDTEAEPIESEIWVKDPDVEEVIYKPIDVTEPDTLEKEGGDTV